MLVQYTTFPKYNSFQFPVLVVNATCKIGDIKAERLGTCFSLSLLYLRLYCVLLPSKYVKKNIIVLHTRTRNTCTALQL